MQLNRLKFIVIILTVALLLSPGCNNGPSGPSNRSPIARIVASPTAGYAPLTVSFDGSNSYDPDGSLTSYRWDFRDGGTASDPVVDHTFTTAGTFEVTLTVVDNNGADGSTAIAISVGAQIFTVYFTLGQGYEDAYPDEVLELIVDDATRCRTPEGGICQSGGISLTAGDHVVGVRLVSDSNASGGGANGTSFHVSITSDDGVTITPSEIEDVVNGIDSIKENTITLTP